MSLFLNALSVRKKNPNNYLELDYDSHACSEGVWKGLASLACCGFNELWDRRMTAVKSGKLEKHRKYYLFNKKKKEKEEEKNPKPKCIY